MNLSLNKFCIKTYRLKNLVRYQTTERIKDETVLEHLGFTAMLIPKLRDIYEFDELKALKAALYHDWAEATYGDLAHPIKNNLPKEMIRQMEAMEVELIRKELGDEIADSVEELNKFEAEDRSVEGMIVAYADALAVMAYSQKESLLGNKEVFDTNIIPYTELRIERIKKMLQTHLIVSPSRPTEH